MYTTHVIENGLVKDEHMLNIWNFIGNNYVTCMHYYEHEMNNFENL
jgi:hypothetical protein